MLCVELHSLMTTVQLCCQALVRLRIQGTGLPSKPDQLLTATDGYKAVMSTCKPLGTEDKGDYKSDQQGFCTDCSYIS